MAVILKSSAQEEDKMPQSLGERVLLGEGVNGKGGREEGRLPFGDRGKKREERGRKRGVEKE